jgi:hypothetical protein
MATVPLQQKFHTIAANVATKERGSSLVNAQKNIYTMQDIIDTVPAGAAVNPTPNIIPYNAFGVFGDTPLSYSPFANILDTRFNDLSGNKLGGIRITGSAGVPNNTFTTVIGDYHGTAGGTTLEVYSGGGITGYVGNTSSISFSTLGGSISLIDQLQSSRVRFGGSELGWVGTFGGPKGGSSFSLPIYLTGLGMTVHIPLYM